MIRPALAIALPLLLGVGSAQAETFPPLGGRPAPGSLEAMWGDFDPRAEPLEVEVIREWKEEGVVLRVVRFRVGEFKGTLATIAAIYGHAEGERDLPGLVQIHGGGQYADAKACLANAKRGYATVSIAWAGRLSSSKYSVRPEGVQLFWAGKTDDPNYRLTTDWGAVDGYHAPCRYSSAFPSTQPAEWTLDPVESPRNSGWFLCAAAARRAITFLEQQPEVDADRIGVYGHSMGGKLTVLAATDDRVKAAAPSCGGVSDRYSDSPLFRATLGDDASLREISCPIIFLSPANDFHGRIVDLPKAAAEIQSDVWRVTCSAHHGHQDTAPFEVATLLWFDEHLKGGFSMPESPEATLRLPRGGNPELHFTVDVSTPIQSIDVFYTQHAKRDEKPSDRDLTKSRFWRHAKPEQRDGVWVAELPILSDDKPILAYANVTYALDEPVSGAGYYYRSYTASAFNLSSLVEIAWSEEVSASGVAAALERTNQIESFDADWEKEWFSYRPGEWARTTYRLNDEQYAGPAGAELAFEVQADQPNELVVLIDRYAAVVPVAGGDSPQRVSLTPSSFSNCGGDQLEDWSAITSLKLSPSERLKPAKGAAGEPRLVGGPWLGPPPRFHNLRWRQAD